MKKILTYYYPYAKKLITIVNDDNENLSIKLHEIVAPVYITGTHVGISNYMLYRAIKR